jgi:Mor family transcriptional regulator
MTTIQVKTIRDWAAAGDNISALTREFMLSRPTIYNILTAET